MPLVERVAAALLLLLTTWIAIRVARQGIWADSHGVKVRNVLRTYDLRWNEIDAIEPPLSYREAVVWRPSSREGRYKPGIRFRLYWGGWINSALYARGPTDGPTFANEVVRTLRRLHATRSRRW